MRYVEVTPKVGMAVLQRVEHGGADIEQAVFGHFVVHHGAIDFVNGVPVDTFDVEEGILRVHFVPEVFEHIDRIVGSVFVRDNTLTRGKS